LIYEEVITQHREVREAEERAYDRFLQTRDALAHALATDDASCYSPPRVEAIPRHPGELTWGVW
jgi:hypothetical protein